MSTNEMSNKQLFHTALSMWKNNIQTGSVYLSVQDAKNSGHTYINWDDLQTSQRELIKRIEKLQEELLG